MAVVAVTELQWNLLLLVSSRAICTCLGIGWDSPWRSSCKMTGNSWACSLLHTILFQPYIREHFDKYACLACCLFQWYVVTDKTTPCYFRVCLICWSQLETTWNSVTNPCKWVRCRHILIYPLLAEFQDIYRRHKKKEQPCPFQPS